VGADHDIGDEDVRRQAQSSSAIFDLLEP
jgi:hypothetical protein